MAKSLYDAQYNPDILSCLANLSNDEVFTPPIIANQMLDLLPQELFSDPNAKFLDPACKSGVFLREIAKRLIEGEKEIYLDLQERINHIMHEQLYGIAITEMTSLLSRRSLYCSKYPNGLFSISKFNTPDGNIRYKSTHHTWKNGKCIYCGASESILGRDDTLETHAYEFIHTIKPEEILNMKFDVIIGNPPYQLDVGKEKDKYALPIYQKFIYQAKKLNPRYLTMIIPARWYTGGRHLDDFRNEMLEDKHIRKLVDFPNPYDVFQGVDNPGGICYFLRDRENAGPCEFTSCVGNKKTTIVRQLDEYPMFIRDAYGFEIIKKIKALHINHGSTLENVVSAQTPFGIYTSYVPKSSGIPCWFTGRTGKQYAAKKDISDIYGLLDKWKLLIPKAPIAGQTDFTKPVGLYYEGNTLIAAPGECCTQTWLVACAFDTKEEVESFRSYLLTKTVRFLILQTVVSQDVGRNKFCFVPNLAKYSGTYTDQQLCRKWGITDNEWAYIDAHIHNYGNEKEDEN